MQFRHEARQALARAKALLDQDDLQVLRYAALELRLTLEAIVYDRLPAFGWLTSTGAPGRHRTAEFSILPELR